MKVHKHPNSGTLYVALHNLPPGADPTEWEEMTDAELAEWIAAELAAGWVPNFPVPSPQIPDAVTPLQMRRALNAAGLRAAVEAAVAASDQDVKDAWEFALEIRRDNPLLTAMAAALSMTEEQVNDLFLQAASFN